MKKIGITGSIGAGKSLVCKVLEFYNIPIFNADNEAKIIMNNDVEIKDKLIQHFGDQIYINNEINKTFLANKIFSDENERLFVNSVVHPIVTKYFLKWCENKHDTNIVGVESALLFEAKIDEILDFIIFIDTPLENQINYVCKRDNISEALAISKISTQNKQFIGKKFDFVIKNNHQDSLIEQIFCNINNYCSFSK